MLDKLFPVLDSLNAEEGETEEHGDGEADEQEGAASGLRGPDGEDYGQAAADEHGSVGGAETHIDAFAGGSEVSEVPAAVNQVSAEQTAEKHDFGGEENPHAQAGGVALLLRLGEVVQESGVVRLAVSVFAKTGCEVIGQRGPPLCEARPTARSCRLPRSRRVLRRS